MNEQQLAMFFEYQRFEQNPHLARLISETRSLEQYALEDDELECVSAAGDPYQMGLQNDGLLDPSGISKKESGLH